MLIESIIKSSFVKSFIATVALFSFFIVGLAVFGMNAYLIFLILFFWWPLIIILFLLFFFFFDFLFGRAKKNEQAPKGFPASNEFAQSASRGSGIKRAIRIFTYFIFDRVQIEKTEKLYKRISIVASILAIFPQIALLEDWYGYWVRGFGSFRDPDNIAIFLYIFLLFIPVLSLIMFYVSFREKSEIFRRRYVIIFAAINLIFLIISSFVALEFFVDSSCVTPGC